MIIDTSVLLDIFLTSRPRHASASRLARRIRDRETNVRVPMHALFELSAAAKQEKLAVDRETLHFLETFTVDAGFRIESVPIDEAFLHKYTMHDLPYLKSGDLIFVAMAKVDNDILITEDDKQLIGAKKAGVRALKIDEFLVSQDAGNTDSANG